MADTNLLVRIAANITDFDRKMSSAQRRMKTLGSDLSSIGSSLTLGVTAPLAAIGGVALKSFGDLDALKRGLATVTGSAAEAERQFAELREVAKLPGLGFPEALRGATNLQAIGFSAQKSKQILLEFGNALASVGRGREDLDEVIRQLGQMASRGKVTADNLKPILERVPQVAAIIRKEFGTIDTEVLQKMGISAAQLTDVLLREMGKFSRVSVGIKNAFENLSEGITVAMADAGKSLEPFAKAFISDFAVPAIENISKLAKSFATLSPTVQNAIVGLTALTALTPLILSFTGSVITNFALVSGALTKIGGAAGLASIALKAIPWVAVGAGALYAADAVWEYWKAQNEGAKAEKDHKDQIELAIISLRQKGVNLQSLIKQYNQGLISTAAFSAELRRLAIEHAPKVKAGAKEMGDSIGTLGVAAEKAGKHLKAIPFEHTSVQNKIIAEQTRLVAERYDDLAKTIAKLTLDGIEPAALALDEFLSIGITQTPKLTDQMVKFDSVMQGVLFGSIADAKDAFEEFGEQQKALGKIQEELGGRNMDPFFDRQAKGASRVADAYKEMGRQVSLVLNDVANDLKNLIFNGGKLRNVMVSALESIAQALVRLAIENTLRSIATQIGNILSKIPALGKILGSVFGTGTSAAGSAAGGAAGSAGGIGGAASGGAAAASSGLLGILGTAFAGVGAASSVIGNFQMSGMNKSLDLIEHEVRFAQIHLLNILNKLNEYLPWVKVNTEATWSVRAALFDPVAARIEQLGAGGGGRATTVTINVNGGDAKANAEAVVKHLRAYGVLVPA